MKRFSRFNEDRRHEEISFIIENVSKSLRKEVIDLVKSIDDETEVIKVNNVLMGKAIGEQFSAFRKVTVLDDKEVSYLEKLIKTSSAPVESKFELIDMLSKEKGKTGKKVFSSPFKKTISAITPVQFRNNQCWKSISPDVLAYSQQAASGVGKAELYFLLIGKNASKPNSRGSGAKGDVIIDGWNIEMKTGGKSSGVMHSGHRGGVKMGVSTSLNEELITWGKSKGYDMSDANPIYGELFTVAGKKQNWLWQFFKSLPKADYTKQMNKYLTGIYGTSIPKGSISLITNKLRPILGDSIKVSNLFAPYVFSAYKKHEKFSSLLVVDIDKETCFNMVDKKFPEGLYFKGPLMARGKSTYAVPEGGMSFKT